MSGEKLTLCPECGWSGTDADIARRDGVRTCPICDTDIEILE
jgi:hypothetical protein